MMICYGGAVHSFTNPAAEKIGMDSVACDARADRRSGEYMNVFFADIFRK